jgi:hypothetical protein
MREKLGKSAGVPASRNSIFEKYEIGRIIEKSKQKCVQFPIFPVCMADRPNALELFALRDLLTEAILRADQTLLRHPAFGKLSLPAKRKAGSVEWWGADYVGFGVGFETDKSDLALYAFVEPSTKQMPDLLEDMSKFFSVPIKYQKGQFKAAARPVEGGHSIGYGSASGETGTMGCVVEDTAGDRFGLSCNHVIADSNSAVRGTTEVWSPGSADGGTSSDRLGVVHDFVPLAFGGAYNDVDTAIAKPKLKSDLDPVIAGIGAVTGWTSSISFGDAVWPAPGLDDTRLS